LSPSSDTQLTKSPEQWSSKFQICLAGISCALNHQFPTSKAKPLFCVVALTI
jgi:hypothetical protein